MALRLKAGSPRCGSGKIGIGNWKDLEEVVLMLEKLGRKPLIMQRLFSYWRNEGCSQPFINSSSSKRNGEVTGMQNLNLDIYDEYSLNMHIYARFYYVALALW
jgi:hypothetical protein